MANTVQMHVNVGSVSGRTPQTAAAWLAIVFTSLAMLLLASLHALSPEFAPSWRMISEYALGHYGWVLSLMFLFMGVGLWALVVGIWQQVPTRAGKVGLWCLIVAGFGGAMASVFDVRHEAGHGIAGVLGVLGFPVGALLVSFSLGRVEAWHRARRGLCWLANLSWISVVLLVLTLILMTVQFSRITGGHLPQHAPKSLPTGVLPLDGWADRLVVLSNCAWVIFAAGQAIRLRRKDNV